MESLIDKALIKFDLLINGVSLTENTLFFLKKEGYRVPTISRSGASFGIEAIIYQDLFINIPIYKNSKYYISDNCKYICLDSKKIPLKILKKPYFYDKEIENLKMEQIGRVCFDRLGITLTPICFFIKQGMDCKFCGINCSEHNKLKKRILTIREVKKVIKSALEDSTSWVKHILISSGAFPPPDFGASIYAEYVKAIKKEFNDLSVYIMIPPPLNQKSVDCILKSGVDEISINIEIFGKMADQIIPGKNRLIGKNHYLKTLKYLAERKEKYSVRSILMFPIESDEETLVGIEKLAKLKVMPIISFYRNIRKDFFEYRKIDALTMLKFWQKADSIVKKHDMLIGPLCIPCQNNTIVLPNHKDYKFY